MTTLELDNQIRQILHQVKTVEITPFSCSSEKAYVYVKVRKIYADTLSMLCDVIGDKMPLVSATNDFHVEIYFITNKIEW